MGRDDKAPPPLTPQKKRKASDKPGTPSAAPQTHAAPAPPNSLAACRHFGDIYTEAVSDATGGAVGIGEKGGMSAAKIKQEAERARDAPAPTGENPCRMPTLEQQPRVVDPDWLGDHPGPQHYKHESDASKGWREAAWTPGIWVIFLRMQFGLVLKRGFRPMCCLCIGVLFMISMNPMVRAVFTAAFGCLALANGIPVLVYLPLFEWLANEAVRRMQKHKLGPSTLINPISDAKGGVFVGNTKEVADTSSKDSTGIANLIFAYLKKLTDFGLGFMGYADVNVYFMSGSQTTAASYDALLKKTGADTNFVAASVCSSLVGIGWLEFGAAGTNGHISFLMPVWCSVLGRWIRARYIVHRSLVDTHVQPSDELCADVRGTAEKYAAANTGLQRLYKEAGLVYNKWNPSENGNRAVIVGDYNGRKIGKKDKVSREKKLRTQLRTGLKVGGEMANSVQKLVDEVVAEHGTLPIENIHKAAAAAGFPSVGATSSFGPEFRASFGDFLGRVGKQLHLVGCMGSIKTKKGKRAVESEGSGNPPPGAKGAGGKKGGAKKSKRPYGPKGTTADPFDMMR